MHGTKTTTADNSGGDVEIGYMVPWILLVGCMGVLPVARSTCSSQHLRAAIRSFSEDRGPRSREASGRFDTNSNTFFKRMYYVLS